MTTTISMNMMKNKSDLINEHIFTHLGPQQALPLSWLCVLTIVYIVILVSGLVGNIVTILVIFRFRYMQTITNLYLCNLAITDLISLMFSLPLELYTLWHQYPWQLGSLMCSLKTLVLEGTANASVLTLVAFTVERFLAICGSSSSIPPTTGTLFNVKSISRIKRIACRNITLIWTISLCGATPLVLLTRINYLEYDYKPLKQSAWCGLAYNEPDKRWELVMLSSTILFFLIPLMIISCLYYQIARKLKKATRLDTFNHSDIQLTDHATSRKIIQSRRIVIRMLVVIVIAFTFCWSPFHAQRLLFLYVTLYSSWNIVTRQINGILFLSAGCLYYLNSSLNPLIYSLLSTRFRAAFMLYVNGCCGQGITASGQSTSGQQRSQRPNNQQPNKSNSNNSVILINGHQLKNACLTTQPGIGAKIKWNSNNSSTNNNHNNCNKSTSPANFSNNSPEGQPQQQQITKQQSQLSTTLNPCGKHHHHHRHYHNDGSKLYHSHHCHSQNNCFATNLSVPGSDPSVHISKAIQNSW